LNGYIALNGSEQLAVTLHSINSIPSKSRACALAAVAFVAAAAFFAPVFFAPVFFPFFPFFPVFFLAAAAFAAVAAVLLVPAAAVAELAAATDVAAAAVTLLAAAAAAVEPDICTQLPKLPPLWSAIVHGAAVQSVPAGMATVNGTCWAAGGEFGPLVVTVRALKLFAAPVVLRAALKSRDPSVPPLKDAAKSCTAPFLITAGVPAGPLKAGHDWTDLVEVTSERLMVWSVALEVAIAAWACACATKVTAIAAAKKAFVDHIIGWRKEVVWKKREGASCKRAEQRKNE